jgi:hypothetical protein
MPDRVIAFCIPLRSGLVAVALGIFLLSGLPARSFAADSAAFSLECAHREVQVITLIEDHGSKQDVSSDKLAEAGLKMLQARATCYEGRVAEAVALYDSIMTDTLHTPAVQAGR